MPRDWTSPARRLAHEERARRNVERLDQEKAASPPDGDDTVTIRVRYLVDFYAVQRERPRDQVLMPRGVRPSRYGVRWVEEHPNVYRAEVYELS